MRHIKQHIISGLTYYATRQQKAVSFISGIDEDRKAVAHVLIIPSTIGDDRLEEISKIIGASEDVQTQLGDFE